MSSIARWSYSNIATVWPVDGLDKYGQPAYGTPYTITCTWQDTGETQTDTTGAEFVPASTYWFESAYGDEPSRGDYIAKFDLTAEPDPIAVQAEKIKKVTVYDMTMFGASEVPDWEIFT